VDFRAQQAALKDRLATPRCRFPPEDEALLIAADQAGATHDEKTALIKQLLEKNGLPWLGGGTA
jgi:hypothetical protein